MVFYDEQPIDPNSAIKILSNKPKIIYSDRNYDGDNDEYHLEHDIDEYFTNKDKRTRFHYNEHDSDIIDEDDDDKDLINLYDNRKQVVNIIEIKRPPKNVPPPETIIYKGRRFRLFQPSKYLLQRAKKLRMGRKTYAGQLSEIPIQLLQSPPPPPLKRGQPMIAK
ncbi:hypothetical protein BLA29_006666, partial [Euroglyphus maynei]